MFSKSDRLLVLAAHLGSISVGFFAVHGVMEQAKAPLGSPVYSKDGPSPTHFSILRIPSPASHPQAGVLPKRLFSVLLELPGDFSLDGLRGPERRQRSL